MSNEWTVTPAATATPGASGEWTVTPAVGAAEAREPIEQTIAHGIGAVTHAVGDAWQHMGDSLFPVNKLLRVLPLGERQMQEGALGSQTSPNEALMDIIGAPQRAIGEMVRQRQMTTAQGWSPHEAVAALGESVFHPNAAVNERTTKSIEQAIHIPSHATMTQWAHSIPNLNSTEKEWVSNILKTSADTGAQMISDPLTALDGVGVVARIAGPMIDASHAAEAMHAAATSVGMGKAFEHLKTTAQMYTQGAGKLNALARTIRNEGIRPDLDKVGLTLDGKQMRLSIEGKWYARVGKAAPNDVAAVKAGGDTVGKRWLMYQAMKGTPEDREIIAKMGVTPDVTSVVHQEPGFDEAAVEQAFRTKMVKQGGMATKPGVQERLESARARYAQAHDARFGTQTAQGRKVVKGIPQLDQELAAARARYTTALERAHPTTMASPEDLKDYLINQRSQYMAGRTRAINTGLASFLNGEPELQRKELNKMRAAYRDDQINKETNQLVRSSPHLLKPGVDAPLNDWKGVPTADPFGTNIRRVLHAMTLPDVPGNVGDLLQIPRALSRLSISIKPWIHEVRNVGQLARFGGGLHMVPWAIKHVLENPGVGASGSDLARLDRVGALPAFFHGGEGDELGSLYTNIPGLKGLRDSMQALDIGYRAALLKTLDREWGDSGKMAQQAITREFSAAGKDVTGEAFNTAVKQRTYENELIKGHNVAQRIGDPRNQDQIVQMMQAVGGYYTSFRLGIVPRNVLATFLEHPPRAMLPLRETTNWNANSNDPDQTLVTGGPVEDFAELAAVPGQIATSQPIKYITAPSTAGILGGIVAPGEGEAGTRPEVTLQRLGWGLVPGVNDARDLSTLISKQPNPQLRDKLLQGLWDFLSGYYSKAPESYRFQASDERRIEKEYR